MSQETTRRALNRRAFLKAVGAATAGSAALGGFPAVSGMHGLYGLIDQFVGTPTRLVSAATPLEEQHLLNDVPVITDNGVVVIVPPLHHQIVTAKLRVGATSAALGRAQRAMEDALQRLERQYPPTPSGLGITVAWGLPYFRRSLPTALTDRYLPIDNRATAANGHPTRAILDAIRFPSDPGGTILEENDVAILLRSDALDHIADATKALFEELADFFQPTSIRKGFVGGGFSGKQSLPKQMAMAAGIPGAKYIPETAELFLGFTSSQQQALGPTKIANLEALPGLTDQWPNGYFRSGTTMHLSHLFEDLEKWYARKFDDRVAATFRPGLSVPTGTQTVPEGPGTVEGAANLRQDLITYHRIGHSASLQPATRLQAAVTDNYGNVYPTGTAIPQRADFNTVDNPFFWSADARADGDRDEGAAGLHFVVFAPTTDAFRRGRLAMDGHMPDGTVLATSPHAAGFNEVLRTTHRQNFLVPPRGHRSFPLAELL
jgi:hypothetical protein